MNAAESPLIVNVGAQTEQGRRTENQDNMTGFSSPLGSVYVVADGMGGHRGGAEASRIAIDSYRKNLTAIPENVPFADALQRATSIANDEMHTRGVSGDPAVEGMGSTVVLAVVRETSAGAELSIGHIGDSRAYLFRGGVLRRLTRDHTAVQRLLDAGLVSPEEAKNHPDASVLTRALGKQAEVAMDLMEPLALEPGDLVLLCSDGLSGYVPDDVIQNELAADRAPGETARALISVALRRGSDDNITVQVLRVSENPNRQKAALLAAAARTQSPLAHSQSRATVLDDAEPEPRHWFVLSYVGVLLLGFVLGFAAHPAYEKFEQLFNAPPVQPVHQNPVPAPLKPGAQTPKPPAGQLSAPSDAAPAANSGGEDSNDHAQPGADAGHAADPNADGSATTPPASSAKKPPQPPAASSKKKKVL